MIILTCPKCQAKFDISNNEKVLGSKVKCYKCETVWIAEMNLMHEDIFKNSTKENDLPPAPIPEIRLKKKRKKSLFFHFLFGIGIAVSLALFFLLKNTGNEKKTTDLSLTLSPLEYKTDENPELIIRGYITNETDELYRLPLLNILLYDNKKNTLYNKTRLPPMRLLGPKRTIEIEFKIQNPPAQIHRVEVNFNTDKKE
ncbi:MAG: zinc-ribbon domain-containing protein [Alphaproteobacteria bacterium]|nr:MAG: hypothetical protein B6I23_03170 [Rickettsiaceae bacterium 4572_127]